MTIAFNLSQLANYVNSSGKLDAANGLVNATPVANGGTGTASATAYAVQCGGTTSTGAHQSIASIGTAGQVLTSNGAGALPTFQASVGGQFAYALYTSGSGNWTCPANVTKVFAIVIGGGAGWSGSSYLNLEGRSGGIAIGLYTVVPSTSYAYVVGAGSSGTGGYSAAGGSSNFSSFCSASGGGNALGSPGVGTNGNLSNWHVPDYAENVGTMSVSAGGVFVGSNVSNATSSGNWSAAQGNIPGASGCSLGTYGGGGVVYLQYVG